MNEDDENRQRREDDESKGSTEHPDPRSLPPPSADVVSLPGEVTSALLPSWLEIWPDALVLVDTTGRIAYVNSQAETLFGYPRSALSGKPLEVLLPERFRAAHMFHRDLYSSSPRTRPMGVGLELYGRHQDGTEFAVDISLSPLLLDGTLHVLAAIRDITERQHLQERERIARLLAEARLALLQLILDELPTCVYFVTGSEARLVLANHAATTLWGTEWHTGQPMLDFLSSNHIRLFDMSGQVLPPDAFATLRALHEGKTVFQHQEIISHPDGTSLPVLVNAVALDQHLLAGLGTGEGSRHISSTEPAALVVIQDVTALKEAEQLKDHFLGLVAHELRNPLAAIKGFATMLLRHSTGDKGTPLTDWQREALAEIDMATNRLNQLTEDLLDVVRLQERRLVLHYELIDLVDLIRRVITHIGQSSDGYQLTFSTSLSHLPAQMDGRRIEQVLTNLLINAMKYSPDGGSVEITLEPVPGGQQVLISVRDQGIGIPQAEQAHIFGRFVRASNSQTHRISGTGLGLYLCRELISLHGGEIWFESTEGAGSTFFLRLPLSQSTSSPDATGK